MNGQVIKKELEDGWYPNPQTPKSMNEVNLTAFVKKFQDISPPLDIDDVYLDKLQHGGIKSITPYGLDIDEVYDRSILEQQKVVLHLLGNFLLFLWLFFFTYALLAVVYVSHVED
jgi:hypothetical protein